MVGTRRVLCSNGCCYECEACSGKPGSPLLCEDCLERRVICSSKCNARSNGANSTQVGGSHYKDTAKGGPQHWDTMWDMSREAWFVGNITKYVLRYRKKDGIKDLKKAQHYLTKLLELEEADAERKILSSVATKETPEGKETIEERCPENPGSRHMWLADTPRTLRCFHCGKVEDLVDPSLVHAVHNGRETLCGAPVVDGAYTVYSLYVTCPECKEKFQ